MNPFAKRAGLMSVLSKQATKNRLVFKNGVYNTVTSTEGKSHRIIKDIFITLLDLSWLWIVFLFAAAFFFSWLLFAGVWYALMYAHGDFDAENLDDPDFVPCVAAIVDFTSCFLFSVETQHTIGYGGR